MIQSASRKVKLYLTSAYSLFHEAKSLVFSISTSDKRISIA